MRDVGARPHLSTLGNLKVFTELCGVTLLPTASASHGAVGPVVARFWSQHGPSRVQIQLSRRLREA